jgi:RNA polymerase sigma factor (sigma-70 family)
MNPELSGQAVAAAESDTELSSWSDDRLVRACLEGNEEAWAALIHRYKRLIYSIPFKYGGTEADAADIFQTVCLEMFSGLADLRKVESLRSWIITVTVHKAYQWKKQQRLTDLELDSMEPEQAEETVSGPNAPDWLVQLEQEQIVRESLGALSPRCAELMRLLFYEHPPLPYAEVAKRLGLATGSIGFIRGRCLYRLRKVLVEKGF